MLWTSFGSRFTFNTVSFTYNKNHFIKKKELDIKDMDDIQDLFKSFVAAALEGGLEAELDEELGYSKYDYRNKETSNSRNGYSKKTMKTSFGDMDIDIPRDRNGEFEPQLIKKHQTTLSGDIEEKIISMYAKGMTENDIAAHIEEIYGFDVSDSTISCVTDKILPIASRRYLRDNPLCVMCKNNGRFVEATVVDHIVPHRGNQKLFWDKNNWQALCKPCHDKKTGTEDSTPTYRY